MTMFLSICAALVVIVVGVVAVFLVQTLLQIKATALSIQILADNANREVERLNTVTSAAAQVAGVFSSTLGRSAILGMGLLSKFLGKSNGKSKRSSQEETVS